jgi:hypothetical protein
MDRPNDPVASSLSRLRGVQDRLAVDRSRMPARIFQGVHFATQDHAAALYTAIMTAAEDRASR